MNNLILDFSGVYPLEGLDTIHSLEWIDLTHLKGTSMYCSDESGQTIRSLIQPYGYHGIHFIDNGNYHYVSLFFLEMIQKPFTLLLFDHHPDMQDPLVPSLLSCGNWVKQALQQCDPLQHVIMVGPKDTIHDPKITIIDDTMIHNIHDLHHYYSYLDMPYPIYISIDKDVLSINDEKTNWDQGNMRLTTLAFLLNHTFIHHQILGVDICGECDLSMIDPDAMTLDGSTNIKLYHLLHHLMV